MTNLEEQGGAKLVTLRINGDEHQLVVEPQESLRETLQDKIGLTGTKEMCDRGACGSCTVIMDGRPVLSCMMLSIECGGHEIETIESINSSNHPLVEAYANNHAMQCGYCTPGFRGHRQGPAGPQSGPFGRRNQDCPRRQYMPLRNISGAHIGAVQAAAKKA